MKLKQIMYLKNEERMEKQTRLIGKRGRDVLYLQVDKDRLTLGGSQGLSSNQSGGHNSLSVFNRQV